MDGLLVSRCLAGIETALQGALVEELTALAGQCEAAVSSSQWKKTASRAASAAGSRVIPGG